MYPRNSWELFADPLEAHFRNHSSKRNLKRLRNSFQNSSISNLMKIRTVITAYLETYGWTKLFLWALRGDANAPKIKMRIKSQRKWKSCFSNLKCKREVCRSFNVSLLHSFVCTFTILQEHVIKIKYGQKYKKFVAVSRHKVKARCAVDLRF